jgi:hypothetical protein
MGAHGIVKILQGPYLYLYSATARESQAISGWLRFHVQVTKNREITTFIFSVQASTVPRRVVFLIFLYRSNGVI